jgi:hypothetical protein
MRLILIERSRMLVISEVEEYGGLSKERPLGSINN